LQDYHLACAAWARNELADAWRHLPAVSSDGAHDVPGDPVIDADPIVLAAAAPLNDAHARPKPALALAGRESVVGGTR